MNIQKEIKKFWKIELGKSNTKSKYYDHQTIQISISNMKQYIDEYYEKFKTYDDLKLLLKRYKDLNYDLNLKNNTHSSI